MMWAVGESGERVTATPNGRGVCPSCAEPLVAKCGEIICWHWAHRARAGDCDSWWEPETAWHRSWKLFVPAEQQEVVMPPHRADILGKPKGFAPLVIELQHSSIAPSTIRERENFYGRMAWVFDVRDAWENDRLRFARRDDDLFDDLARVDGDIADRLSRYGTVEDDRYDYFAWSRARSSIATCKRYVFFDIGCGGADSYRVFRVKKFGRRYRWGGWGHWLTLREFCSEWMGVKLPEPGEVAQVILTSAAAVAIVYDADLRREQVPLALDEGEAIQAIVAAFPGVKLTEVRERLDSRRTA